MQVTETQNTTITGDLINGEMVITLKDVNIHDFFRYRAEIRRIVGGGGITLSYTKINEIAIATENKLEKQPETHMVTQTPPVSADIDRMTPLLLATHLPQVKPKIKIGKIVHRVLERLSGQDRGTICKELRRQVYNARNYSDETIMEMFNKVHGIR
jgi:DNA primase catalytic subunit